MVNLQVAQALSATAQPLKDQNGNISPLTLSTGNIGIGTMAPAGKLAVDGNWDGQNGALTLGGDKPTIRFSGGKLSGNQQWLIHDSEHGPGNLEFFNGGTTGAWSLVMSLTPAGRLAVNGNWDGQNGALTLAGHKPTIRFSGDPFSGNQQWLIHESENGPGDLEFYNGGTTGAWSLVMSLTPDGNVKVRGDILLTNADCAEDFDICATEQIEPGTVMVLGEQGVLCPSRQAYDKRVAGVLSGAGDYKPGIILDRQESSNMRKSIALLGKVYCKVDAQHGAIEVGDLLTTAPTPGHAMKTDDPFKAFGAVIGKALRPLPEGQGLIPILIALQ